MRLLIVAAAATLVITGAARAETIGTRAKGAHHHQASGTLTLPLQMVPPPSTLSALMTCTWRTSATLDTTLRATSMPLATSTQADAKALRGLHRKAPPVRRG